MIKNGVITQIFKTYHTFYAEFMVGDNTGLQPITEKDALRLQIGDEIKCDCYVEDNHTKITILES